MPEYFPAIYELDGNMEATGSVHFFCSRNCRSIFAADPDGEIESEITSEGMDSGWQEGTLCENCGVALLEAENKLLPCGVFPCNG